MKNDEKRHVPPTVLYFYFIDTRLFVSLWLFRAFDASSSSSSIVG
jgi:hypothetical protein